MTLVLGLLGIWVPRGVLLVDFLVVRWGVAVVWLWVFAGTRSFGVSGDSLVCLDSICCGWGSLRWLVSLAFRSGVGLV